MFGEPTALFAGHRLVDERGGDATLSEIHVSAPQLPLSIS